MNNKGKTSPLLIFISLAALILLGVTAWGVYQSQTDVGEDEMEKLTMTGDCEQTPVVEMSLLNAVNPGTGVSGGTFYATQNGDYIGTISNATAFNYGDEVQVLTSASDYIDELVDVITVKCGTNRVVKELYATSENTFRAFNTNSNLMSDVACTTAGNAVNQSDSSSPISIDLRIDSTTDESTGDLLIVIESSNTTEVDDMVLSGNGAVKTSTPEFYTVAGAGSITRAYEVPALIDGETNSYTISISPESSATIGAGENSIYVTAYSKQAFVDTDGSFTEGYENIDGTVKYEDTWDRDFCISDVHA